MYLRGMQSMGDAWYADMPAVSDFPSYGDMSLPVPSSAPPTQSTDWTSIFKTALSTWGTVAQANAQVEATKARYASPYGAYTAMPGSTIPGQTFPYPSASTPGYLPFPGAAGSGINGTIAGIPVTIILLGAAAIAAFMIARS